MGAHPKSWAYLVGLTVWADELRLWSLANVSEAQMSGQAFKSDPEFDLRAFAERSFGAYQEPPLDIVLRFTPEAARDAATFLFHPT